MFSEEEGMYLSRRIAILENQVAFLYRHLGVEFPRELPVEEDPQVIELLRNGKKMEAISIVRERTGYGLKDAKDAVEAVQRKYNLQ